MSNAPYVFFSIIIPVYNKELSVSRAIDSVLRQSHDNFELILVDDGSTDNSWSSCAQFDDHRIKRIQQSNQGVAIARNRGASEASGDYLCFLDADDRLEPDFLQQIIQLITLKPGAALYCCRYQLVGQHGETMLAKSTFAEDFAGEVPDFFSAYRHNRFFIHTSGTVIGKHMFWQVGGFPAGVKIGEDIYLWMQLALKGAVMHCSKPAATVFQDAENRTIHVVNQSLAWHSVVFLRDRRWTDGLTHRQIQSVDRFVWYNTSIAALGALRFGRKAVTRGYVQLLWRRYPLTASALLLASYFPATVFASLKLLRDRLSAATMGRPDA